jgi:hypothetical protein
MYHIFISYAREDQKEAKAIADIFDSEGFDVWWDTRLYVGQRFPDVITDAIKESQHVIVLWTPFSVKSEWVQREASLGKKLNKLMPVQMRDCDIPKAFQDFHTVRFTGQGDWGKLLEELFRGIGQGGFIVQSAALHRRTHTWTIPFPQARFVPGGDHMPEPYRTYANQKRQRLLARHRKQERRQALFLAVAVVVVALAILAYRSW